MKLAIYSIFDEAAGAYITPFFTTNQATAERSFAQAANDEQHLFHISAKDYTLFELGAFDQDSGTFTTLQAPRSVGNALQYRTVKIIGPGEAEDEYIRNLKAPRRPNGGADAEGGTDDAK